MYEYLKPLDNGPVEQDIALPEPQALPSGAADVGIDRTAKMYIGGKQARPDSGHSSRALAFDGSYGGLVSEGNRKGYSQRSRGCL